MANCFKSISLSGQEARRVLRSLYLEFKKKRLSNDTGDQIRVTTDPFAGIVITAYDSDKVLVQGTGEKHIKVIWKAMKLFAKVQEMQREV